MTIEIKLDVSLEEAEVLNAATLLEGCTLASMIERSVMAYAVSVLKRKAEMGLTAMRERRAFIDDAERKHRKELRSVK